MLYLDSSALAKRYSSEKGSPAVVARFETSERIFSSMLSFGEIHSFMGRKFRSGEVSLSRVVKLREEFLNDWLFSLSVVDVDTRTMSELPRLVEKYELRAADAIHLSSAFWLRDTIRLRGQHDRLEEAVEFGVADKRLAKVAHDCGFRIFNPEENG